MSRLLKLFLIGLLILAGLMLTMCAAPNTEQIVSMTVEAKIAQSVPIMSIDEQVNATLIALSETPTGIATSTSIPLILEKVSPTPENKSPTLSEQITTTAVLSAVAALVNSVVTLLVGLFVSIATSLGASVFVGQCCCVSAGLAIIGFIAKLLTG